MIISAMLPISAATSQVLTVGSGTGTPGSEVAIPITLNDGVGLAGIQYNINYDKSQFSIDMNDGDGDGAPDGVTVPTATSANPNLGAAPTFGPADSNTGEYTCDTEGYISVVSARANGASITSAFAGKTVNSVILHFKIKAGAINGTYPLTISNLTATNGTTDETIGTPVAGSITITGGVSAPSKNANLASISSTPTGTMTPAFNANTTQYAITLPYGSGTPTTNATKADAGANVSITQATSNTGKATIVVTAEDTSVTKTYEVQYSVAEPSHDADLTDIKINGTSIPGFDKNTLTYSYVLPYNTTATPTITVTKSNSDSSVNNPSFTTLTGTAIITVTAQDGTTQKAYTINISKALSPLNDIVSFSVPDMIGTAAINTSTHTVTAGVPFGTSLSSISATFGVSPDATVSPASPHVFDFTTTQSITVTAQDGTPQVWTVIVTEGAPKEPTGITITGDSTVSVPTTYTATVTPSDASFKTVIWSVDNTTIASIDASSGLLTPKQNGTVTITAQVQNRTSIKTTKTVTIQGQSVKGLTSLSVSSATLSPSFSNGTLNYTTSVGAMVSSVNIFSSADTGETIKINGVATTSTTAAIVPGPNNFTIEVSADGKFSKTYTLVVNRAYPYIVDTTVTKTSGILVTGTVTNDVSATGDVYVVVKLMKGTTTLDVIESKYTVSSSQSFEVKFNAYSGNDYTAKVFVRNAKGDSTSDYNGVDYAAPVVK